MGNKGNAEKIFNCDKTNLKNFLFMEDKEKRVNTKML